MGQTPAKFFPWPQPYGQNPDSNVLAQAKAAPLAPQQNFLPLNQPDPSAQAQPQQPAPQNQLGLGNRRNNLMFHRNQLYD